jgi:hypothetical protein
VRHPTSQLLGVTSLIELGTGIALIFAPAVVARLLLGGDLAGPGIPVARVAGFALLSLGIACWPGRGAFVDQKSAVGAMLAYNMLITLYLLDLGLTTKPIGALLWPAVALHGLIAILLIASVIRRRA